MLNLFIMSLVQDPSIRELRSVNKECAVIRQRPCEVHIPVPLSGTEPVCITGKTTMTLNKTKMQSKTILVPLKYCYLKVKLMSKLNNSLFWNGTIWK